MYNITPNHALTSGILNTTDNVYRYGQKLDRNVSATIGVRMDSRQRAAGDTDPRLGETVVSVADIDDDISEDLARLRGGYCIIMIIPAIFSLCFPCILLIMTLIFCCTHQSTKKRLRSVIEKTEVYITDSTFVWVDPTLLNDRGVTTIPLADIATVVPEGKQITVNVKPTAPQVMMNSTDGTTYATRSIKVNRILNAEHFASSVRERIMQ